MDLRQEVIINNIKIENLNILILQPRFTQKNYNSRYLLDILDSCEQTLDVCIHLLTSVEIANSIVGAHKRGARVRVICDNEMSTNKGSQVRYIYENGWYYFVSQFLFRSSVNFSSFFLGVEVRIPLLNYHMHSKIAIVDGKKVMTGSVNWTVQGNRIG